MTPGQAMTRDADIARIAAALHEFKVGCVHVAAFLHESQHRDDAERLYDAGLRPSVEPGHPDAENTDRNHYDWFMPADPTAVVDDYLDDFEAKLTESLTDPFVHDMAHSVLPLIAAYRALRPSVEPPLSERESADGAHMPRPSDICSVCGNGLVHIDSWRDRPSVEPAGLAKSYSAGNPTNVTEVELSDDFGATWREAEAAVKAHMPYAGFGVEADGPGYRAHAGHPEWHGGYREAWSVNDPELVGDPDDPATPAKALRKLAAALLPTQASDSPEKP